MPLSYRYAQVLLLVALVIAIVVGCGLALAAGSSGVAIPPGLVLLVVFALAVTAYAYWATIAGLTVPMRGHPSRRSGRWR